MKSEIDLISEKLANILSRMDDQHDFVKEKIDYLAEKVNNVDKKTETLSGKVMEILMNDKDHYINCPNRLRMDKLEEYVDDIDEKVDKVKEEVNGKLSRIIFFLDNPKLTIGIIAAGVFFIGYLAYSEYTNLTAVQKIAEIQKLYRTDGSPVWRGGSASDTLKIKSIK